MTDTQTLIGVVTLLLGGLGGLVKWCFGQWREERKADREERREDRVERKQDRDAQVAATTQVAVAMNTMSLKFDAFERQLFTVGQVVEHVADEITGNHRIPVLRKPSQRADTAPLGGFHGPRRPRQDTP